MVGCLLSYSQRPYGCIRCFCWFVQGASLGGRQSLHQCSRWRSVVSSHLSQAFNLNDPHLSGGEFGETKSWGARPFNLSDTERLRSARRRFRCLLLSLAFFALAGAVGVSRRRPGRTAAPPVAGQVLQNKSLFGAPGTSSMRGQVAPAYGQPWVEPGHRGRHQHSQLLGGMAVSRPHQRHRRGWIGRQRCARARPTFHWGRAMLGRFAG